MQKRKTSPTIKDVAKEAGVALGTASKVINGIPVGKEYRIRVEEAIKKLNYRVNPHAQSTRSGHTRTIQVMVPNLTNPFFAKLVECIANELTQRSYKTMLCMTDQDTVLGQTCGFVTEQQMADGVICLSYDPKQQVPEHIPMVSVDYNLGHSIPCVASDNYSGGRLASEKLVEFGCKHLAFFGIGASPVHEANKRKDGFVSACEELGVPYALKLTDDGTPHSVFEEFLQEHMGNGKLDFDGIFCATDSLACRILGILRGMELRVPEDVQIIGFDGVKYFVSTDLPCSTIVQPIEAIAETCIKLVLDPLSEKVPSLVCLPVSYAYGGTTKN